MLLTLLQLNLAPPVAASLSKTLGAVTLSSTATVATPGATATVNATLGAVTLSSSAVVGVTLGAATLNAGAFVRGTDAALPRTRRIGLVALAAPSAGPVTLRASRRIGAGTLRRAA